jgi:HAMP domain-containing protein
VSFGVRTTLRATALASLAGAIVVSDAAMTSSSPGDGGRRVIWLVAATGLGVAFLLLNGLARRVSVGVGEIAGAARKMAGGDFSVRTRIPGRDELTELGQSLDRLAGVL